MGALSFHAYYRKSEAQEDRTKIVYFLCSFAVMAILAVALSIGFALLYPRMVPEYCFVSEAQSPASVANLERYDLL
jgi:hypothetical protein